MAMEKEKTKMSDLCEEVLEDIFSRVPFKSRTRMECVSKDWCRLISPLPRVSPFGLILMENYWSAYRMEFEYKTLINIFDLKDQGEELECVERSALRYTLDGDIKSVCYSNGLLLCWNQDNMHTSFVYNMLLKQSVLLPLVEGSRYIPAVGMGLAYSGLPDNHYKVICFFCDDIRGGSFVGAEAKGYMDYKIYSTETGEWRKDRAKLLNSSIFYNGKFPSTSLPIQCLFHEGVMHWTFFDHLIVYNLQENFFDIHKFPRIGEETGSSAWCPEDECLWMSEGCLHYCYCDKYGFYIWARVKGEQIDYDDEHYKDVANIQLHHYLGHDKDSWKLKHRVSLETLKKQHPEFFPFLWGEHIRFFKPCPFNEDLQILYLKLPNHSVVVSYSFELRCLRKVRELKFTS